MSPIPSAAEMAEGNGELVDDLTGSGSNSAGSAGVAGSAANAGATSNNNAPGSNSNTTTASATNTSNANASSSSSSIAKADERGGDGERTEDYPKLLEYGLDRRVSTTTHIRRSAYGTFKPSACIRNQGGRQTR